MNIQKGTAAYMNTMASPEFFFRTVLSGTLCFLAFCTEFTQRKDKRRWRQHWLNAPKRRITYSLSAAPAKNAIPIMARASQDLTISMLIKQALGTKKFSRECVATTGRSKAKMFYPIPNANRFESSTT